MLTGAAITSSKELLEDFLIHLEWILRKVSQFLGCMKHKIDTQASLRGHLCCEDVLRVTAMTAHVDRGLWAVQCVPRWDRQCICAVSLQMSSKHKGTLLQSGGAWPGTRVSRMLN